MSFPAKLPLDGAQWARLRMLVADEVERLRESCPAYIEIKDIREAVDRGIAKVFERPKPSATLSRRAVDEIASLIARAACGELAIASFTSPLVAADQYLRRHLDITEVDSVD